MVREYQALIVPMAESCVIPTVDAYALCYPEVASNDSQIPLPNLREFATYTGYGRGSAINMPQIDLGSISFKEVEFLALDILQAVGFDLVLGRSLLRGMRLDQDFASGRLRLERVAGAQ